MAAVKCVFSIKNGVLTTISGADAGSYAILDNHANILISEVEYQIQPYNPVYCSIDTKQQLRTTVNT
jgi:hypothetical protein